ncbi:MAG: DUF952 domain-containing protein [Alphaproteobacteria bacterium]|nr:DUF952 domain-containing protein [Alphaproteobacteria bacterium]
MSEIIYKICPEEIWRDAEAKGQFNGAGIDLADGFIHFSTADQVAETAFLHFNGVSGLVLVRVMTKGLDVVWEESRGGRLFPHLYSALPMAQVDSVLAMPLGDDGEHVFPSDISPRR